MGEIVAEMRSDGRGERGGVPYAQVEKQLDAFRSADRAAFEGVVAFAERLGELGNFEPEHCPPSAIVALQALLDRREEAIGALQKIAPSQSPEGLAETRILVPALRSMREMMETVYALMPLAGPSTQNILFNSINTTEEWVDGVVRPAIAKFVKWPNR
jgi:hypothetical protein